MRQPGWKNLLFVVLLLPAAANADDATLDSATEASTEASSDVVLSLADYGSRWKLDSAVDSNTYHDRWPLAAAPFDVRVEDNSSIISVAKIRSLSFLTLAGDERSKWFLGINEDGFVGVHFRGFTRESAKRHVDLATLLASDDEASY